MGWVLRIPLVRRVLFCPGVPRVASFLARRLPRWPVRGRTAFYECDWEECELEYRGKLAQAARRLLRPEREVARLAARRQLAIAKKNA